MTTSGNLYAAFRFRDAPKALIWLHDAFGFEPGEVVPNPDGTIAHAELFLGNAGIMLGSAQPDSPFPLEVAADAPQTVSLFVSIDPAAIDAHFARAKAAGAEIVMDLYDTDYGSREYSARDFEGHLWSFGTYVPKRPA